MVMRATAMVRTKSIGSSGSLSPSRVPLTFISALIGTLCGMLGQGRERMDHADAVVFVFAHADDAAAAHIDAGVAHMRQRVEAVLEGARGDDLLVILRRGVDVVVVIVEAGVFSRSACGPVSMPSVTQVSMPSALTPSTMAQTASRSLSLGERQAAPMQKRVAPDVLRGLRVGEHGIDLHQLGGLRGPSRATRFASSSRNPPGSRRS